MNCGALRRALASFSTTMRSRDIAALAVRLMMAVVWAHPFEQGNKRTGFAAAEIFLDANGWILDIPDFEDIAEEIILAAEDHSLEGDLAELFRRNLIEMT